MLFSNRHFGLASRFLDKRQKCRRQSLDYHSPTALLALSPSGVPCSCALYIGHTLPRRTRVCTCSLSLPFSRVALSLKSHVSFAPFLSLSLSLSLSFVHLSVHISLSASRLSPLQEYGYMNTLYYTCTLYKVIRQQYVCITYVLVRTYEYIAIGPYVNIRPSN